MLFVERREYRCILYIPMLTRFSLNWNQILALIGLRNRDKIVSANAAIIKKNVELLKSFFDDNKDFLEWCA